MQLQHAAFHNCWRSFAASVTIAVISVAIAVIIVIIDIAAPVATAAVAHSACVCCCRQLYCCRSKIIVISSSSSIGIQSSAVHGRAVARNSSYCEAPTLRSNATTSLLFQSMANLRGVIPTLQAGG